VAVRTVDIVRRIAAAGAPHLTLIVFVTPILFAWDLEFLYSINKEGTPILFDRVKKLGMHA
jgi:hypothetical protein